MQKKCAHCNNKKEKKLNKDEFVDFYYCCCCSCDVMTGWRNKQTNERTDSRGVLSGHVYKTFSFLCM